MAESEATARKAFERFDEDGDGFVTGVEFLKAMRAMGDTQMTLSVAERVLGRMDLDGDQKISFEEFVKVHQAAA